MRVGLAASAVAFLLAGCRTQPLDLPGQGFDGPSPDDGGAVDFASPGSVDLARPGRPGCAAIARCAARCSSDTCLMDCLQNGSGRGRNRFLKAERCGVEFCLGNTGPSARCARDPSGTLVDAPGVPPGDCNQCLQNGFAALFGASCSQPSDPACMNAVCQPVFDQCLAN